VECVEPVPPPPPGLPRVPCRSCRELGWSIEAGLAEVCAESDDGFECTSEVAFNGPGGATNVCQSAGARLCSSIELEAGEGTGTGCGHDNLLIWSRSRTLHDLSCETSEKVVVSGSGLTPPECKAKTDLAAVRCCADLECPDPDAPPPPPPSPTFTAAPCQSCTQLGWPTEAGDIEVCAESDAGFECAEAVAYQGSRGANLMCQSLGARLCTAVELRLGEGSGTGCGHDARMIWSSSYELDALTCDRSTERVVVSGANSAAPACMLKRGDTAAVRCCADVECVEPVPPPPPGLPRVPCRSCRELGWAVEKDIPDVCAESDDGFECTSEVIYNGGNGAINICQSLGARLCSATELFDGAGAGSGCDFTGVMVWSRSRNYRQLRCASTEKVVVPGDGVADAECMEKATGFAALRCCADLECPDSTPAPTPPPPGGGH